MLPRIFTGMILSVGCIIAAQTAERAFDVALEEIGAALAAPKSTAAESSDCTTPEHAPCEPTVLYAGELPPDVGSWVDCVTAGRIRARLEGGTA